MTKLAERYAAMPDEQLSQLAIEEAAGLSDDGLDALRAENERLRHRLDEQGIN